MRTCMRVVICCVLICIGSVGASLADSVPQDTVARWNGLYAGAALGMTQQRASQASGVRLSYFNVADAGQLNDDLAYDIEDIGFSGGLFGGVEHQFDNNVLLGVEVDLTYAPFASAHSQAAEYQSLPGVSFRQNTDISADWFASVRPRFGYVHENTLFYLTGGLAATQIHYAFRFSDTNTPGRSLNMERDNFALGAVYGLGVERALSDGEWRVRAEFLHYQFDNVIDEVSTLTPPDAGFSHKMNFRSDTIRIGIVKTF